MDEKLRCLLAKGGVTIPQIDDESKEQRISSLLSLLESWLGFSEADDDEDMTMMEDTGPFDEPFYRAVEDFLIEVWRPDEIPQHKFFGLGESSNGKDETVSLYKSIICVRVTRFLRYWMELNVGGRQPWDAMVEDQKQKGNMLSFQLLKHCSFDEKSGSAEKKLRFFPLIQALYQHIEQLPFLQSQIYLYSQSVTRGTSNLNRPGLGLANPQSRLAQLQLGQKIKESLEQEFEDHVNDVEYIVGEWYELGNVAIRRQCRAQLGSVWSTFEARSSGVGVAGGGGSLSGAGVRSEDTSSSGIALTLRILHRILMGISSNNNKSTLCKSHEHLLFQHLIPLHRPNSMVLWRDQTCLLALYHEPLVQCIAILLQQKPKWTGRVIEGLMASDVWNKGGGNTPKLVLLLHEIDTYIGCLPKSPEEIDGDELGDSLGSLLRTLGGCMASENSRLAQRALPFVKNKKFVRLIETNLGLSLDILLPFLLRKEPSWNPTVRKMTYNVLALLKEFDSERFVKVGNRCFANERRKNHREKLSPPKVSKEKKSIVPAVPTSKVSLPTDYTIKSAMGNWAPPTKYASRSGINASMPPPGNRIRASPGSKNPPLTVTGVAPWAMKGGSNPPLAVTGVAPWAMKGGQGNRMTISRRKQPPLGVVGKGVAPWAKSNSMPPPTNKAKNNGDDSTKPTLEVPLENATTIKSTPCPVLAYMKKIKPPKEETGISSWSKTQMAESPTLLPTLKFHDLVFGHDLGEGSFGSVRYARLIDRTTTRSRWPEYAVKVISTEKIKELGYEAPIQREMAVLRVMSHPCVARMISSFRFREGVYLVLEYASGGDLHTLLKTNGSLDHDSTRFVIGEVTSALASIHEIGLGYFDLKPENIVITESGHVKLTDFGGSRPVTQAAKEMLSQSAKNVFNELRDGDWKTQKKQKTTVCDMDEDEEIDDENGGFVQDYDPNADLRIEGTTIYLPPEVVAGSFPTLAADSWALGCVLYQCLTGRPPILEVDETLAKKKIVSFDIKDAQSDGDNFLFGDSKTTSMEPSARGLIIELMDRDASERPTMTQVADHSFFQDSGIEIFSLWRKQALKLEVGDAAPPPADAGWARRQLSSIWAPQPQAYDVSSNNSKTRRRSNGQQLSGPIPEGGEAPFFFSKSNILPSVRSASQAPLPPRKKVAED